MLIGSIEGTVEKDREKRKQSEKVEVNVSGVLITLSRSPAVSSGDIREPNALTIIRAPFYKQPSAREVAF